MSINTKVSVTELKETTFALNAAQITELLKTAYPNLFIGDAECKIVFDVPSGGDYSGMSLDLNEDPLRVVITSKTTKGDVGDKGIVKYAKGLYEVTENHNVTGYVLTVHDGDDLDDEDNDIFSVSRYEDETEAFIAAVKNYLDAHNGAITFLRREEDLSVSAKGLYEVTGAKKGKIKFSKRLEK